MPNMTTPLGRGKDRRSLWRQVGVHSFTAAPATPAPAKTAVPDAARRTEIEALMRVDGGKGYWRDPAGGISLSPISPRSSLSSRES
jgi:hypothetical protein